MTVRFDIGTFINISYVNLIKIIVINHENKVISNKFLTFFLSIIRA